MINKKAMSPVQESAYKNLAYWLLGSGALGTTASGIGGLYGMLKDNLTPEPEPYKGTLMKIPYQVRTKPVEEASKARGPSIKAATAGSIAGIDTVATGQGISDLVGKYFGNVAEKGYEIPALWPGFIAGVPLAGYGGYKLMSYLRDKHKKMTQDHSLDTAKKDYEQAILDQYKPLASSKVQLSKLASDNKLTTQLINNTATSPEVNKVSQALEKLASLALTTKHADISDYVPTLSKVLGPSAGIYSVLAPALAGLSGTVAYQYAKGVDPGEIAEKRLRDQIKEKNMARPVENYAFLQPVDEKGRPIPKRRAAKLQAQELEKKASAFVNKLLKSN